jgi:hypothetical protein
LFQLKIKKEKNQKPINNLKNKLKLKENDKKYLYEIKKTFLLLVMILG